MKATDERNRYANEQAQRGYSQDSITEQDSKRIKQTQTEFIACAQRVIVPAQVAPAQAKVDDETIFKPLTELRDRMCSCADRACVTQVALDFNRYVADVSNKSASDAQRARAKTIADQLMDCERAY